MKHAKGIPMPKKRDNSYGANFEELSSVKNLDGKILMMHSVVVSERTVLVDLNSIQINDPVILEMTKLEGELKPEEPQVIVNFSAIIPTNIGRKELH